METSEIKMQCPIAIIGAGFVSDMYVKTLENHPHLKLVGVHDRDAQRTRLHADRWKVPGFGSIAELLEKSGAQLILNLTNPRSHFAVTKQCLEAGKHVYSEKPLGMNLEEGKALVQLARERGLMLDCAPCSWMSEAAQTMKKAIDDGLIGKVRLAYANFDDGLIAPKMNPWHWRNGAGIPWPAKDEFEVGCTYEHAGYVLTWLHLFFGPARSITSFASCQIPDKGILVDSMAPDFTVGCITYDNNIVARVTCGLVAPRDKSLMVVGDEGIIYTNNVRSDVGPVYIQKIPTPGRLGGVERRLNLCRVWLERYLPWIPWSGRDWQFRKKLPLVGKPPGRLVSADKAVDFLRGPSHMAKTVFDEHREFACTNSGLRTLGVVNALQSPFQRPAAIGADGAPL